jgi:arginyl-tRNA synthetase
VFPARLAAEIRTAMAELVPAATELPGATPAEWIRRPRRAALGDFTIPARRWAAAAGVPTELLAGQLVDRLRGVEGVAAVEATGDGFVNIRVDTCALVGIVRTIVAAGPAYGREDVGHPDTAATPRRPSSPPMMADETGYAHARMCRFLRSAQALGIEVDPDRMDAMLLASQPSRGLVCALAEFPAVVVRCGLVSGQTRTYERRLNRYLTELLALLGSFEDARDILPKGLEEPSTRHVTRLVVVDGSRIVLANALTICGLDAPSRW